MGLAGKLSLFSSLALLASAGSASAATFVTNGSGQLIGIDGLVTSSGTYDMRFRDGSCVSEYSGCDEPGDFTFTALSQAQNAASVLLNTILANPTFGGAPSLTFGCSDLNRCSTVIAYSGNGAQFSSAYTAHYRTGAGSNFIWQSSGGDATLDYSMPSQDSANFAVFGAQGSFVSAGVPEPSTWAMLLLGFFGVAGAMRTSRHSIEQTLHGAA